MCGQIPVKMACKNMSKMHDGYSCLCLKTLLLFYSVLLRSQAGEGATEERCRADEGARRQLQTRSSGVTGESVM